MDSSDWLAGASRVFFLGIIALLATSVDAADAKKPNNWAATELSEVDEDFNFQGEYAGTINTDIGMRSVGLQVVALGDGKFDAVLFADGLPGSGSDAKFRVPLQGTRRGTVVPLTGTDFSAGVWGSSAAIHSTDGQFLGLLSKIHRRSPMEGRPVPPGGISLSADNWQGGFKNPKVTPDGLLKVGTETKQPLRDYTMHVEFRLPYMPYARGQGRSNSGIYLQSRYEVQILDSFGLEGKNNECGSLYTYKAPDINMCYPPLAWQTYDIEFRSPRFDEKGKKTQNGRLTVLHNGVAVQNRFEFERKTGAGQPEGPTNLPTKIQDHGNPVVFRNIWIVDDEKPKPAPAMDYPTERRCEPYLSPAPFVVAPPVRFAPQVRPGVYLPHFIP